MIKFYLAARYSRRDELRVIASKLRWMGHEVTSSWLETNFVTRLGQSSAAPPEYRAKHSLIDLKDIQAADIVVNFTESTTIQNAGRGGRHVEFGYALALGKRLIVVGHRENLFHEHPSVEFYKYPEDMLRSFTNDDSDIGGE